MSEVRKAQPLGNEIFSTEKFMKIPTTVQNINMDEVTYFKGEI